MFSSFDMFDGTDSCGGDYSRTQRSGLWPINPVNVLNHKNAGVNYAVVVLNQPIKVEGGRIASLWNGARFRVLVDGGANRWLQFVKDHQSVNPDVHLAHPDIVTGDMDSISQAALQHYSDWKNGGTTVIRTPDQDETDYTKALSRLAEETFRRQIPIDAVFTVVESTGRLDHTLANINTLHKAIDILYDIPIFHMGCDSLSWLLPPGSHLIEEPDGEAGEHWCGMVPVGGPCKVTTAGLKWDVQDCTLAFGGLISTSNAFDGIPTVSVQTDGPLLWCMGIRTGR